MANKNGELRCQADAEASCLVFEKSEIVGRFEAAMREHGIETPDEIVADGALHRIHVRGDKRGSKNGFYVLHADGIPAGHFGSWRNGEARDWCIKNTSELDSEERKRYRERIKRANREREAAQLDEQEAAARKAFRRWEGAIAADPKHPYLVSKSVSAFKLRQDGDRLLVPVEDFDGGFYGLQFISPKGEKRFLRGTKKKGHCHLIGSIAPSGTVLLSEGFATAATLHQATGHPAVAAFDAGNLLPVAKALRAKYPDANLIVCADNDRSGDRNPGLERATAAAKAVNGRIAVPEFGEGEAGSDWNDFATLHGLSDVATCIAKARRPTKPDIYVVKGRFAEVVDEAVKALKADSAPVYIRGGVLARPVRLDSTTLSDGVRRGAGSIILKSVEVEWLRLKLAEAANWWKFDGRKDTWVEADPPLEIAKTIAATPDRGNWPHLRAVVRHPMLFPGGRYVSTRGYDRVSGLYIDAPEPWPPFPSAPTYADAVGARKEVEYLLRHFPFASDQDRAVALALLTTAVIRSTIDLSPGFAVDAPVRGAGKSLLIDATAVLTTSSRAPVLEYSTNGDETAKRVDAALLSGDLLIAIDNIEGVLEGAAICSTLTQATRKVRMLGESKLVEVPCMALLTFTGNNLVLRGDITRRVLTSRLAPDTERPEHRPIEQDLIAETTLRRSELVTNLQVIIAAYIAAGRPKQNLRPYGGFKQWDRLIRHALVWCGAADPLATMERTHEDDPQREALVSVLTAWHKAFGCDFRTVADAIDYAEKASDDLRAALSLVCSSKPGGGLDPKILGNWLRRNRDSMSGGFVLRRGKRTNVGWDWCVVKAQDPGVSGASCASSPPSTREIGRKDMSANHIDQDEVHAPDAPDAPDSLIETEATCDEHVLT